jgi:hypothetical protein
MSTDLFILTLA